MILLSMILMCFTYPLCAFVLSITGIVKKNDCRFIFSFVTALLFGMIGYYFIPSHETDLTRYFDIIDQYKITTPNNSDIIKSQGIFSASNFLFKWIAAIGNNQVLPAIVGFMTMFVFIYIAADYFARINIAPSLRIIFLCIGMCLFPLATALNNVRNVIACALLMMAVYRDLVQKKVNLLTLFLYVLSITFHMAVLAIVFIRLLLLLKVDKPFLKRLLVFVCLFCLFLIPKIRSELSNFVLKGTSYTTGDIGNTNYFLYVQESSYMKITKLLYLLVTFGIFIILISNYRRHRSEWTQFNLILCIVTLLSFIITLPVYTRFLFALLIGAIPSLADFFLGRFEKKFNLFSFLLILVSLGAVLILIANVVTFMQYTSVFNVVSKIVTTNIFSLLGGY